MTNSLADNKPIVEAMVFATLLLATTIPAVANDGRELLTKQRQSAVNEIVKLGGKVTIEFGRSGDRVVEVVLICQRVDDSVMNHLRHFPELQTLRNLNTNITDAFLLELEQFKNLQTLGFFKTKTSDAGLAGWSDDDTHAACADLPG